MLGFVGALQAGLPGLGLEVRAVAPRARIGRLRLPGASKWLAYADKYLLFPPELRRAIRWADVVHVCDQGNAMYSRYLQGVPHIVTCHDMLAIRSALGEIPAWRTGPAGRIYQSLILSGIRRSRCAACVSSATQRDLLRIAPRSESDARVVYNGLYRRLEPMPRAEASAILAGLGIMPDERYLLHVGGNQFYKNRNGVLQIYAALRRLPEGAGVRLVMAGKPLTTDLRAAVSRQGLAPHVVEAACVSDEQIRALLSRAQALLFPSLHEGFGLPIVEAQACGCPVFTSNRAPMTEVGGDAAVYFDPAKPEEAAALVAERIDCLSAMRAEGFENARRFSTERMLQGYAAAYDYALETQSRRAA
jgi:glycosyltransferase involved in cell wall biosynthesis